ncbi:MAG TPA: 4-alpha-glucanotransferase [Verrucomicrobiae bacterium]|jgi:4-alpha-glucanotransferase|nr:4-alpha-glucanotransferase [Verrucomicrobiae bacterium]
MSRSTAAKPKRKSPGRKKISTPARTINLTLRLRYHTNFGQSIFVTGNHELLGNSDFNRALPLQYLNDEFWQVTIALPVTAKSAPVTYNYFVRESTGALTHDWGADKVIHPASLTQSEVLIIDSWNYAGYSANAFATKPFKKVLLPGRNFALGSDAPANVTHIFKVKAPLLTGTQTVCLAGEGDGFRHWQWNQPILFNKVPGEDFFTVALDLSYAPSPLTYKYGVYDIKTNTVIRLEDGEVRTLQDTSAPGKLTIINDGFAVLPADAFKGAGVAIPVFSLRSENGFGVGEFLDLKTLADWGKQAGLKLIQLLPINDTIATKTWVDSYPYAAISAFALHPIYLNLEKLTAKANQRFLKKLSPEKARLNGLPALDYEAVINAKLAFVKKIFPSQSKETFATDEYKNFFEQNKHWLVPYAAFSYLRDKFGTPDFEMWPRYRKYNAKEISSLAARAPARDEIEFYYFTQYHLHCQLKEATDYAHSQGLVVKGDLPIGIHRHGADAWQNPELYHLDMQAGAPPDAFAVKGQNWGFPTYNWPRMQQTNFAWWKHRCEQMSLYFDAFRIDHILGFFRIWSIPLHAVEGILGYFVPAIPVKAEEFPARGITLNLCRLTQPYITDQVLRDIFQNDSDKIKSQFLTADGSGNYSLKPDFATQRQVERHFAKLPANESNDKIKIGLYDLISNVVLFEVPGSGGKEFHFRLGMADTSCFKTLDAQTQSQLNDLYVDYFYRRQDDFWMREAMQKLPALKRVTDMLVCGEDLGMVPDCVPEVMRRLGLLSLEIQRMPKLRDREFSYPREAAYLSVVTPGTHDMSTIRGWWEEEDKTRVRKFYEVELNQSGRPPAVCEPWINRAIIIQHLESSAMWSIFQLQDLLGMDEKLRRKNFHEERINVPANPKNHWQYRMHLTLEMLKKARAFTEEFKEYVQESGR